jgi:hypothetical protein
VILELRRPRTAGGKATIGKLYVDDEFECDTLEDLERFGPKIPGQTAIPTGLYKVALRYSPHFKRIVPWILDVPQFDYILIHPGNDADDTKGCLLVGTKLDDEHITRSVVAFNQLFLKIQDVLDRQEGEVWLNVTHAL